MDIKIGVVQERGGGKRGEVISGDSKDRNQRGGGTIRDPGRKICNTPAALCPGKDIKKIP